MRYRFIQAEKAHYPVGVLVSEARRWPGVACMRGAGAQRALARSRISGS